jgi:hypothetical protein
MAQMGAISAATATSTMGAMGAVGTTASLSAPIMTLAFQVIGLGFLLTLPNLLYQLLLIVILAFTLLSSYLSYKSHKVAGPFLLTFISSLLVYGSVYLIVYEPLYWLGFALMLASGVWNFVSTRSIRQSRIELRTPVNPKQ